MPLMFRSDRVCAVMFSQQGGPGRNLNEYGLIHHKIETLKHSSEIKNPTNYYILPSRMLISYFCACIFNAS